MTKLIRRYSALLALCCILAAAFALPYLVATNPDSAAFRSGSLYALLMIALFFPIRAAFSRQSLRELGYGMAFAYVFALCVGLGCELECYNQLLPGLGSLARRFAAPMMIAPALGALVSFVFALDPNPGTQKREIPFWAFFAALVGCYGVVFLALYPGVVVYDFEHEIRQYATGVYEAAHPVFHTLFLGTLYALGEAIFGSMTAGAALYSAVQLVLLAALYAWALRFVQRRVPLGVTALLFAGFALLPFHGVMAVSTAKDPLFAGLCTVLSLLLWALAEDPAAFLNDQKRTAGFVCCCLLLALLRHNGVFAYVPALLAVVILGRRQMKRALAVALAALTLCIVAPKGLEGAVGAEKTPSTELLSVPCQQLMRTARVADLTEAEFEQVERWFPDATHTYRPHCADPAKGGNFNSRRYREDPMDFLTTYAKYAIKQPRVYMEAFLLNSMGMWYPGDTSHAHALCTEGDVYVYMNAAYGYQPGRYPIEPESKFPAVQALIHAFTRDAVHEEIPFLAQLFCPATYTFALLLAVLLLLYKKQRAYAFALLPMVLLTVSVFFAAGVFVRYVYPMMATVPLLLTLALFARSRA